MPRNYSSIVVLNEIFTYCKFTRPFKDFVRNYLIRTLGHYGPSDREIFIIFVREGIKDFLFYSRNPFSPVVDYVGDIYLPGQVEFQVGLILDMILLTGAPPNYDTLVSNIVIHIMSVDARVQILFPH